MSRNTGKVIVTRQYEKVTPDGYKGWIEDKKKTWILYYTADGGALFFPRRDKKGGVIGTGIPSRISEASLEQVIGTLQPRDYAKAVWATLWEAACHEVAEVHAYHKAGKTMPNSSLTWENLTTAVGEILAAPDEDGNVGFDTSLYLNYMAASRGITLQIFPIDLRSQFYKIRWQFTPDTDLLGMVAEHERKHPGSRFIVGTLEETREPKEHIIWEMALEAIRRDVAEVYAYHAANLPMPNSVLTWENLHTGSSEIKVSNELLEANHIHLDTAARENLYQLASVRGMKLTISLNTSVSIHTFKWEFSKDTDFSVLVNEFIKHYGGLFRLPLQNISKGVWKDVQNNELYAEETLKKEDLWDDLKNEPHHNLVREPALLKCRERFTRDAAWTTDGKPPTTPPGSPAPQPINESTGMHGAYWVLPEEERKKGFVRPYRDVYTHVGRRPKYPLADITEKQKADMGERAPGFDAYTKFEAYPEGSPESEAGKIGRFWTEKELASGCGMDTKMSRDLSETYATKPSFYGSTFCSHCKDHLPVGEDGEFIWKADGTRVGT